MAFTSPTTGTGTVSATNGSTTLTGSGTAFLYELAVGCTIVAGGQTRVIATVASDTSATVTVAFSPAVTAGSSFTTTAIITQTGTETSLANLNGVTGVTRIADATGKYWYVLATCGLRVNGTLTIDPDVECLVVRDTAPRSSVDYRGTLQIGRKRTSGGVTRYSSGDAIVICSKASADSAAQGFHSGADGSSFIGYGGRIVSASAVSFCGRVLSTRNGTVLIESLETYSRVTVDGSAAQIRFDNNAGQSVTVAGLTVDCEVDNVTGRSVLLFATDYTSFSCTFKALSLQNFQSSAYDLTFSNLSFANNYRTNDLVGNSNLAAVPVYTLLNCDIGTSTTNAAASGTAKLNWLYTQAISPTLKNSAGAAITSDAKVYITETDDGNRFQPIGRTGFTWTTVETTTMTPNGSGLCTGTIRVGIKKHDGTTLTSSYFGKSSADDFDLKFCGYLYNLSTRTEVLRKNGGLSFDWGHVTDSLITQTTKATVDAYTGLETAAKWYDYAKSNLLGRFAGETATDISRSGTVAELGSNSWTVSTAAASVYNFSTKTIKVVGAFTSGANGSGTLTIAGATVLSGNIFTMNVTYSSSQTTLTNVTCTGTMNFTVAGTYTIDGCIIDEVTNSSGGNVILNVINGGYITTNGGPNITINYQVEVTLLDLIAGSEIRAFVGTPASATLIASTESSGTTFTFTHSVPGQAGFIVVRKVNYKFDKISLTYSSVNTNIPVKQRLDPNYANP